MLTHDDIRIWLAMKIRRENYFHGGVMPRESALYWLGFVKGYLSAGGITEADHAYLLGFLPLAEEDLHSGLVAGRDELPQEDEIEALEPRHDLDSTAGADIPLPPPRHIDGRLEETSAAA